MHVEPGTHHRIALVGATGRIGRAVARVLSSAGADYRALSRDGNRARRTLGSHAHVVEGDLRSPAAIEAIVRGADRLLLACADPSLERAAIEAASAAGVTRIVKISAAAGQDACTPAHQDAEDALRGSRAEWTLVRPTALMQTLADAIALVARDGVVRLPAGDAPVAWVDARDVAAVVLHALVEDGHAGATWTVTGPEAVPLADAVRAVARATGRPLRYVASEPTSAEPQLRALGLDEVRAATLLQRCEVWRSGALATTTDVVRRIARMDPRSFARFAATHDFGLDVELAPSAAAR